MAAPLTLPAPAVAPAHVAILGDNAHASEGCSTVHTVHGYRSYASRVYKRPVVSLAAHRRLAEMHVCQRSYRARKAVGRHHDRYKRAREQRKAIMRLTPYRGPNGSRWAIPWYIVACESRGSWSAYNPSGARGPYQLLGWKVPWPARTQADRLAHHRMATRLWRGGAGASHWVCA